MQSVVRNNANTSTLSLGGHVATTKSSSFRSLGGPVPRRDITYEARVRPPESINELNPKFKKNGTYQYHLEQHRVGCSDCACEDKICESLCKDEYFRAVSGHFSSGADFKPEEQVIKFQYKLGIPNYSGQKKDQYVVGYKSPFPSYSSETEYSEVTNFYIKNNKFFEKMEREFKKNSKN